MANLVAKSVESNRIDVVMSDEKTPLNSSHGSGYEIEMSNMSETYQSTAIDVSSSDNEVTDDSIDFFSLIKQEIDKINKFFVGKLAELQSKVDIITNERKNVYYSLLLTHSLTHSFTHLFTHSLTYLLTYSCSGLPITSYIR